MNNYFVEVSPVVPLNPLQRQTYTYHLLEKPAQSVLYRAVTIKFGRRFRLKGIITGVASEPVAGHTEMAQLIDSPPLTTEQVALAQWMARTMHGGLGFTLRLFLPPGKSVKYGDLVARLDVKPGQPLAEAYISPDWSDRLKKIYKHSLKKLKNKQQLLILVPEIWLAERIYRFMSELTDYSCEIVHGGISAKKYGQIWDDVYSNRCHIIIGTQKALFLPFRSLGVVVLEEEGFATHTLDEQYPRLSNLYSLKKLASLFSSEVIYTSLFPSIRLWKEIDNKDIQPRLLKPVIPNIQLVLPKDIQSVFETWRTQKQKIVILYNRKNTFPVNRLLPGLLKNVTIGTTAILPSLPQLKPDQIVWFFPEHIFLYPDFRSTEQAMHLLARLQAELGAKKEVVVVTRYLQRFTEQCLQPLEKYISKELAQRRRLHLPPYTDMVRLRFFGRTQTRAWKRALTIREEIIRRHTDNIEVCIIRGPIKPVKKIITDTHEVYILLFGRLSYLKKIYTELPIDGVDLDPPHLF